MLAFQIPSAPLVHWKGHFNEAWFFNVKTGSSTANSSWSWADWGWASWERKILLNLRERESEKSLSVFRILGWPSSSSKSHFTLTGAFTCVCLQFSQWNVLQSSELSLYKLDFVCVLRLLERYVWWNAEIGPSIGVNWAIAIVFCLHLFTLPLMCVEIRVREKTKLTFFGKTRKDQQWFFMFGFCGFFWHSFLIQCFRLFGYLCLVAIDY